MAIHPSAEKKDRQSKRKQIRNKERLSKMKTLIKAVKSSKAKAEGEAALKKASQWLDRLAANGTIHKNNAANHKSSLTKLVNKLPLEAPKETKAAKS